jgi:D-alanyl-D-alanine dipeptidase
MKKLYILTLILSLFTACQAQPLRVEIEENILTIPSDSSQLLMVTTENWSTKNGKLQRYEREDSIWKRVGNSIDIVLGRNGLGWGVGLHSIPKDAKYIKKEGDGKSPAGLFTLGNGFGYNNFNIDFPYSRYKRTDHCVDDSSSKFYNTIIDSTKVKKDYKSFEHMRLKNDLYKYGITVNHNENQVANAGSCIFVHIRSKSGKGTAGCTAMKEIEIVTILKWLKENKKPLLLQLPQSEVTKVIADYSLK